MGSPEKQSVYEGRKTSQKIEINNRVERNLDSLILVALVVKCQKHAFFHIGLLNKENDQLSIPAEISSPSH